MVQPVLIWALVGKAIGTALWFSSYRTAAATAFFGPDPFVLYALFAPSAQGLVRVFTRFVTDRPVVWLTIDDGPDEHDTPHILELLDRHHARATFFVIGERAARSPHLVREIIRRGHDIGHHTHTHPAGTFWCSTPRQIASELDRTLEVLEQLGVRPRLFRPPVGIKHFFLARALAQRGLQCVGWSVRSGDCRTSSPEKLVAGMARHVHPGSIILLHEGPSVPLAVRIKGIALLLETLEARGYSCVIPDVLQLR
jgi:peptidoglycan/xylan/chitin deacetylase (PgdA/CDA1 family)